MTECPWVSQLISRAQFQLETRVQNKRRDHQIEMIEKMVSSARIERGLLSSAHSKCPKVSKNSSIFCLNKGRLVHLTDAEILLFFCFHNIGLFAGIFLLFTVCSWRETTPSTESFKIRNWAEFNCSILMWCYCCVDTDTKVILIYYCDANLTFGH